MSMMYPIGDWPGTIQPYIPTWPQTYTVPQVQYSITVGQMAVSAPTSDEVLRLARLAGILP